MKWLLLEEFTPHDDAFIASSIESSDDSRTFTPSEEFLERAYVKLNKAFFNGRLPTDIKFKIEYEPDKRSAGHTDADNNANPKKFNIHYVSLNGCFTKRPHSWIETILHEMIHVDDFANHPDHFAKSGYNEHGGWFKTQIERLKEFGFDIGEKDMDDDIKASPDSEEVKRRFNNSIFILLGRDPVSGLDSIVKIEKDDKEPVLLKLKKRGCKTVKIIKTDNLNSIWLDDIDFSDVGRKVYQLDDDDKSKYGPFEEVETLDLTKFQIDESKLNSGEWKSTMTVVRLPNGRLHIRT